MLMQLSCICQGCNRLLYNCWVRKSIKYQVSSILGVLLLLLYLIPNTNPLIPEAYAHVLKSDGSIGAVMHIDPNDDPVANSPATFFFEIKDKTNKFTPQNCDCRVDIYENGKVIYSDSLFVGGSSNNISSPVFQYTFPQKDVYQVKVVGTPQQTGDFQPFTLTYDLRVDKDVGSQSAQGQPSWLSSHLYLLIGLAVIAVVCGLAFVKKPTKE